MRISNCRSYQRHDHTSSTKQIRLSARHWAIIEAKQKALAKALGVPWVSRPVALGYLLEEDRCRHHRQVDAAAPETGGQA